MTAQEQLTLKTVILHNVAADAYGLASYRLLNDLGHDVSTTESADQAMELMQHDRPDLVIIDADPARQVEFVNRLTDLPSDQQPRQVAIFSDTIDASFSTKVQNLGREKVHVLLKPLHMHGLLNILRNIEGKA